MIRLESIDIDPLEEGEDLILPKQPEIQIKTDQKLEQHFHILEELGKGKFGVVKRCQGKTSGVFYAAKYVKKTKQSKQEVTKEIEMMGKLHHKRLVGLKDAFETPQFMIVVMELITGGELFEKVVEEDNLTERQVVRYLRQVLFAVQHMHRYNMVHLDLKPENILCVGGDPPGFEQLKLIDFGMTRILEPGKEEIAACGTAEFVGPEVLRLDPITLAVDMWSLGVITYVLLSGLSPFLGDNDSETLSNVSNGEYDFDDGEGIFDQISDGAKEFIEGLLVMDVTKRKTVDECLEHDWLTRAKEKKLKTDKLKKFIARRRWQRTTNALKALTRLGNLGVGNKLAQLKIGNNHNNPKVETTATTNDVQQNGQSTEVVTDNEKVDTTTTTTDEAYSNNAADQVEATTTTGDVEQNGQSTEVVNEKVDTTITTTTDETSVEKANKKVETATTTNGVKQNGQTTDDKNGNDKIEAATTTKSDAEQSKGVETTTTAINESKESSNTNGDEKVETATTTNEVVQNSQSTENANTNDKVESTTTTTSDDVKPSSQSIADVNGNCEVTVNE